MTPVEFVYLLMLLISLPLGHLVKMSRFPAQKQLICIGSGVLMILVLCGQQSVHSLFTTFGTAMIIKTFGPRYCKVQGKYLCMANQLCNAQGAEMKPFEIELNCKKTN